jgi:hypothetical protein
MQIVEYRKHLANGSIVDPEWVIKGGYFHDRDADTYMGFVLESSERKYYIPDTVTFMTEEEAIQRVKDIHAEYPYVLSKVVTEEGTTKTYREDDSIESWVRGIIEDMPDSDIIYSL